MDVTAFETEEADSLTWDEVVERVPQSIQTPVSSVWNYLNLVLTSLSRFQLIWTDPL